MVEDDGCIGSNEESNSTSSTGWSCWSLVIDSDISADSNTVSSVPGGTFDPRDSIEESISSTVTGIDAGYTLNILVSAFLEELHKESFGGFRLIK